MEEFVACFAEVVDPRQDNARHNLHELLLIALCTILTGGKDCSDMALFGTVKEPFLRQFLRLRHGIPSHDTFSRVFRLLDPAPFEACFTRFMQRFAETLQGVVAIDGKTLRRSFDRAAGKSPLHMLHAWSVDQRLLLGQLAVDGKSNEITAVPKLLDLLSLKGRIVTADALNCQRAIAAKVVAQGGDYVLALKGNQGCLHDDVRTFLDDPARPVEASHTMVDGDHGRIETRTSLVSSDIEWLQEQHAWPGLMAIGKVVRTREIGTQTSTETAYYLLTVVTVWAYRHAWDGRNLAILLPGAVLGIGLGYLLAAKVSDAAVALAVGAISIAFAVRRLVVERNSSPAPTKPGVAAGWFWGAACGFTSMIAHAGGPRFQIYVQPRDSPATFSLALARSCLRRSTGSSCRPM